MEEAYALYKKYEANDMMDWTGRHLLNLYAQQKKGDKMAEIYPEYKEIHDSLQLAEKQRYAIGANVRYETGRKEQENRALSAEVALKERSLVYTRRHPDPSHLPADRDHCLRTPTSPASPT